ncbi:ammonium transporter [Acidithiobacillus ferrivorans]|uniref:Ammonium transporter n=1 Tax=Acidithiobacillus ferrivorans TaxID=160808 RepID=A0A060URB8_9PROT|nr:ammonium transporter [Acidithiobacillus ferrivorans]QQD73146.1 ammonium transporter [Acidithiobacillus ferrivorans]CDQ10846.1 Ammonia channel precursor (Ammonia transporter) [Acidithiobacillus ferrivorans]SMH65986.1 ammonium transporter [Acidithiobacillus ferrivorans]
MQKGAIHKISVGASWVGALTLLASPLAQADTTPPFNSGDTAWMLSSTALVLLMTVPGLALFYAGMVRKKNVLATAAQSFAITALISVLWMIIGYSLTFTAGNAFMGGLSRLFLNGMGLDSANDLAPTIPESVYMTFQMTFAIITPALIVGAFAERMKFSALLWFTGLWSLLVYAPIAHMVWGPGGWLAADGVLDYAGGTVVHINAGIAGLVAALVMGKRIGYRHDIMHPNNLMYTLIGASLLWVGWFGFNAGSAVAASDRAGMAMATTQIATAVAALSWMFAEWLARGKPTVLGMTSGAVAGLVAITPASGFVGPMGALWIGLAAGAICFWAAVYLKNQLGYDDSLDAFGVHAIGGIIGALLTGVFAVKAIGGTAGVLEGNIGQLLIQATGVGVTIVYDAIVSFIILKVIDWTLGLRVKDEQERDGLDITQHGEQVYE